MELKRQLGFFDSLCIVVGCTIGSGIFIVPSLTTGLVQAPSLVLLAWVAGGVLSLCGALAYAELGSVLPEVGGEYVFQREAYGRLPAFLYGWSLLLVIQSGSVAALSAAFARFVGYFLELSVVESRVLAVGLIVLMTAVNCRGVRLGAVVQNVLTVIKVAGVAAVVAIGFAAAAGSFGHLRPFWPEGSTGFSLLPQMGAAMVGVMWAYKGWEKFGFVAGEIRNPARTIPLSLIAGVAIVIVLYLSATLSYLYVLPNDAVSASKRVAADAMAAALGPAGGAMISLLIILSVAGAINGGMLAGPRVHYAMARDGLFFSALQRIHPRYGTPAAAIVAQGAWASVLASTGSYERILTYVMFATAIFYGMAVAAVIVLRQKHPEWPRPFAVPGYPVVPVLFVLAVAALTVNTILTRPVESAWGLGIVLLGLPVYFAWRRRAGGPAPAEAVEEKTVLARE